jgi:hypothetical protein
MTELKDNSIQIYRKLKRFFIEREIAKFYEYLNTLDNNLDIKTKELSENIGAKFKDLDKLDRNDDRRKELIDLKVEAEQGKGFTNLLRQSFLSSLYSFMELWLIRECHLDSKRGDKGKSYKSTKGKGIQKVKNYFSDTLESDYPFGTRQDWLWMTKFQLLRDCIVHRQGSLTGFSDFEVDSTLAKFVKQENDLSLFGVENNQFFVEYNFCLKSLKTVHRFMLELLALNNKLA